MGRYALELINCLVEIGILVVLIMEFNYDKIQIEKKHYKKKTRAKFDALPPEGEAK